jgi:hypothetical protein
MWFKFREELIGGAEKQLALKLTDYRAFPMHFQDGKLLSYPALFGKLLISEEFTPNDRGTYLIPQK